MSHWDDFIMAAENARVRLKSFDVNCQGEYCEIVKSIRLPYPQTVEQIMADKEWFEGDFNLESGLCKDCSDAAKKVEARIEHEEAAEARAKDGRYGV